MIENISLEQKYGPGNYKNLIFGTSQCNKRFMINYNSRNYTGYRLLMYAINAHIGENYIALVHLIFTTTL